MKNILKNYLLAIVVISISVTGCDKFPLIKNASLEPIPAGENLKSITIWDFLATNDFHTTDATNISLYAQAVQYSGLKDMLNGEGKYTITILDNLGMAALFKSLGYENKPLDEIPPVIVRNILLNLMAKDQYLRSFDIGVNENRSLLTVSNDTMYLSRQPSTTDLYRMYVNDNASILTTSRGFVKTQNLQFKNGVAYVVGGVGLYYSAKSSSPDATPANLSVYTDTLFVTKDTYIVGGVNSNTVYHGSVDMLSRLNPGFPDLQRRILMQFPLRQPTFSGRIGSAKLTNYVYRLDGGRGSTVNVYEDEYKDWVENTTTWNNAPQFGNSIIGTYSIPATGGINKYYTADITATLQADINSGRNYINLGLYSTPDLMGVRPRENTSGKFKSYIVLSSPPATILSKVNNQPLSVNLFPGFASLSLSELQFSGTENKNISYIIKTLPSNGFIGKNSGTFKVNSSFTQEEVARGLIKYFYNGTAAGTDSFTVEVKDFRGGYFADDIVIPVQIQ